MFNNVTLWSNVSLCSVGHSSEKPKEFEVCSFSLNFPKKKNFLVFFNALRFALSSGLARIKLNFK